MLPPFTISHRTVELNGRGVYIQSIQSNQLTKTRSSRSGPTEFGAAEDRQIRLLYFELVTKTELTLSLPSFSVFGLFGSVIHLPSTTNLYRYVPGAKSIRES